MPKRGAGGTKGGIGRFLLGLAMMASGGYLLLNSITVVNTFSFGMRLYRWGPVGITSGMVLVPFIFGIGMIFYNGKNPLGWGLAGGSLIALVAGAIANIRLSFASMSAFDLLVILVLLFGGVGLFLSSLQELDNEF